MLCLVEWECVNGEEVDFVNDSLVGPIDPGSPRVHMGDFDALQRRVCKTLTRRLDEANNGLGTVADSSFGSPAGLGIAVQVLAANREADNEVCQARAVLLDGRAECFQLIVDVVGARCPDSQEQFGVGGYGGCEGANGRVGSLPLDVGVQADGVKVAGRTL